MRMKKKYLREISSQIGRVIRENAFNVVVCQDATFSIHAERKNQGPFLIKETVFPKMITTIIKSPRFGVTLCFQSVSAASAASAAAKTFPSHVKTV